MTPELGESASVARTFTMQDVAAYATLAEDRAAPPAIVPGPLIGGMFSQLLGTKLPGRGTNWLKQKMRLIAPAFVGETLIATVRVVRVRPEKGLVNLSTTCATADGRSICDGEALVLCKEME
jgi:3-hydroxybutyryl-CoA dehydratase